MKHFGTAKKHLVPGRREMEAERRVDVDQNPNNFKNYNSEEWDAIAQSWLSAFPDGRSPTTAEFQSWFEANHNFIPEDIKSMAPSDIYQTLLTIPNTLSLPLQEKEGNHGDSPHVRFQRTDQWIPVYSWLESLDKNEVVKSKDIADWLDGNPDIKEQLGLRHSRYHLTHYIKKCHAKMLRRKEKKKVGQLASNSASVTVQQNLTTKQLASPPSSLLKNLPEDDDVYLAKRKEALQKFEILLELEKKLLSRFRHPR